MNREYVSRDTLDVTYVNAKFRNVVLWRFLL